MWRRRGTARVKGVELLSALMKEAVDYSSLSLLFQVMRLRSSYQTKTAWSYTCHSPVIALS
jgi:hypothetical protein